MVRFGNLEKHILFRDNVNDSFFFCWKKKWQCSHNTKIVGLLLMVKLGSYYSVDNSTRKRGFQLSKKLINNAGTISLLSLLKNAPQKKTLNGLMLTSWTNNLDVSYFSWCLPLKMVKCSLPAKKKNTLLRDYINLSCFQLWKSKRSYKPKQWACWCWLH